MPAAARSGRRRAGRRHRRRRRTPGPRPSGRTGTTSTSASAPSEPPAPRGPRGRVGRGCRPASSAGSRRARPPRWPATPVIAARRPVRPPNSARARPPRGTTAWSGWRSATAGSAARRAPASTAGRRPRRPPGRSAPAGGSTPEVRAATGCPAAARSSSRRASRSSTGSTAGSTGSPRRGAAHTGHHRPAQGGVPQGPQRVGRTRRARPVQRPGARARPVASRTVEGSGPDDEAQRRVHGEGLAVDADLDRPARGHLELGGGPLVPAREPADLAGGLERGELLGIRGAAHQHRHDTEPCRCRARGRVDAPRRCESW